MSKFYITTAIDYPNGNPHIGHLYEKIITDTYARWHRHMGDDTYFLTGTDENGQKLQKSAEEAGYKHTMDFVDTNAQKFVDLCEKLSITNDDFIRTTEERHLKVSQQFWLDLKEDIYFDRYSGQYCVSCENFYSIAEGEEKVCPEHHKPLEFVEEDGYFLKTSRYQQWIIDYIKNNEAFIFPKSARKEILSRLESDELRDLSLSRPNQGWGISVPDDDKHVMYTWFDALINYVSALDQEKLEKYWPADVHVIGKDITWFHTVIWPIMLHASGRCIAKSVLVHGMILGPDGRKMSKSIGNVISPDEIVGNYPNDLIRYYMCRAIGSGQDGRFAIEDMIERHNKELANDFGNLCQRVIKFARKKIGHVISQAGEGNEQLFTYGPVLEKVNTLMTSFEHTKALDTIWEEVNKLNQYLNEYEPWRIKDDPKKVNHMIYNVMFAIENLTFILVPFLPDACQKIFETLSIQEPSIKLMEWDGRDISLEVEPQVLFEKIDAK